MIDGTSLPRVLFVDDEPRILEGLQNMLRKHRKRWHMAFAQSGEAALALLGRERFDVIVSDMRMPGMDGAELLSVVKERWPNVARMVLSGHAEREAVLRALSVAHQFLSKPCDAETLRTAIDRTCDLQSLLGDERLQRLVGRMDRLPSVPESYSQLTRVLADPGATLADVAGIVERDPAMAVKVLQLVNSAYFGFSQKVTSIAKAVSYLGMELLKGLALTANVFASAADAGVPGFSVDQTQRDSLLTARIMKRVVADPRNADDAFTAAMVHEIGKVILALCLPDDLAEVARESEASKRPTHQVERSRLGLTHAEIGAYLLGVWGLPFSIVESVAYHHRPSGVREGGDPVLGALHLIDSLVEAERMGVEPDVDRSYLESAGLVPHVGAVRAVVREELRAMEIGT